MSCTIHLSREITESMDLLTAIAAKEAEYLGSVVSSAYQVNADGKTSVIPGQERSFDRALAVCLTRNGSSLANLSAVKRLRADQHAWDAFQDRLAEIAGTASKWPEVARQLSAPAGNA